MKIEVEHINKTYKSKLFGNPPCQALRDISFCLETGNVLALIGQNGAGKTTLVKCILNFLHPDSGNITIDKKTILEIIHQGQLGFMPETLRFPGMITFKEYITDLMVLRGKNIANFKDRFDYLTDQFHMKKHIDKLLTQYSKGTMKKAAFIQSVLHSPGLLILDEPTDGLDPVSRHALLNEILEIKRNGGTVIITTHLLSDLAIVADKIIVLQNGSLICETDMSDIHDSLDNWYLQIVTKQEGVDEL